MRRLANVHDEHDPMNVLSVLVLDEPGPGGDCHHYEVSTFAGPKAHIHFQEGDPIQQVNGITMESLLAIMRHRLEGCQQGPWSCVENEHALRCINEADQWLKYRKRQRG